MKAILRHVRLSPKKANLVAGLVRRKSVREALDILNFTPKKGAPLLLEVIKSAAANATNNFKQKEENLFVDEIVVTEGVTMKRFVPVSRGRAHPIRKRTSHITVKIGVQAPEVKEMSEKKVETKEAEVKESKTTKKTTSTKSKSSKK